MRQRASSARSSLCAALEAASSSSLYRTGRREVHLDDRRDPRADRRGAVGVARALPVPGRRGGRVVGERVTEAGGGRMGQEAVDPAPVLLLQIVDVDVAALAVERDARNRPLRAEDRLAVEREPAPQMLVLAVVAVVGLDRELGGIALPVRDVELVRGLVAAVVLPQPLPLLERPVRAVGRRSRRSGAGRDGPV